MLKLSFQSCDSGGYKNRRGAIFQPARQECMLRLAGEIKLHIRSLRTEAGFEDLPGGLSYQCVTQ